MLSTRSLLLEVTLLSLFLAGVSYGAQLVAVGAFTLYCDGYVEPGSLRETMCDVAEYKRYWPALLLPPATVLGGGLIAYRRRRIGVVAWIFCAALLIGAVLPLSVMGIVGTE